MQVERHGGYSVFAGVGGVLSQLILMMRDVEGSCPPLLASNDTCLWCKILNLEPRSVIKS